LAKTVANASVPGALFIGAAASVTLQASSQIADLAPVAMASSGLLDLNDKVEAIGSLSGSGHVDLGSGELQTGFDNSSTTYSGLISGAAGSLIKRGAGNFTLTATN